MWRLWQDVSSSAKIQKFRIPHIPLRSTFLIFRFATKYSLNNHIKLVHQRRYEKVCHICAKVYSSSYSFRQHMKEHSEVKDARVVCQLCGRTYKNAKGLRNHMMAHKEADQEFRCPQCPKISPNRHALKTHIRVMHNYKVHKCQLCERECKSAMALTEHMATHTNDFLYNCTYCARKFKSHSNMYQHYRDAHPVEWSVDRKTKPKSNHRATTTLRLNCWFWPFHGVVVVADRTHCYALCLWHSADYKPLWRNVNIDHWIVSSSW